MSFHARKSGQHFGRFFLLTCALCVGLGLETPVSALPVLCSPPDNLWLCRSLFAQLTRLRVYRAATDFCRLGHYSFFFVGAKADRKRKPLALALSALAVEK